MQTLLAKPRPIPIYTCAIIIIIIIKMAITNKTLATNSLLANIAFSYAINMKKQCAVYTPNF